MGEDNNMQEDQPVQQVISAQETIVNDCGAPVEQTGQTGVENESNDQGCVEGGESYVGETRNDDVMYDLEDLLDFGCELDGKTKYCF